MVVTFLAFGVEGDRRTDLDKLKGDAVALRKREGDNGF